MQVSEGLLTPEAYARHAPSRPVLEAWDGAGGGLILQRFRHPPSTIDVPGMRDAILVDHLVGPVLVEEDDPAGRPIRRWTRPGQISLTPAGQPLRRILKGRPDVVLLHLGADLLDGVAEEIHGRRAGSFRLLRCFGMSDPAADQLTRLLLTEAEAPGPSAALMSETLARALAIHLLRVHSTLAARPPRPDESEPAPRIRRVIERMRRALDEELTLDRLAAAAGLSRSQFVRAFRSATGMSPHRYLQNLRIERARTLLEQTAMPVIEIALSCGFGQPGHFATVFRASTGLSPREWRQARRA